MPQAVGDRLNYDKPIEISKGIYWVGFYDSESGLHCNPYLILDGDEAVLIDGGSRPDFPSVMMKILQTGLEPRNIKALIYQHYDPDLVGGIADFEAIIGSDTLQIISHAANHMFIRHYAVKSSLLGFQETGGRFTFSSGRRLEFIPTPYAHSAGSFVTFDTRNKTLFSSDLFGSYSKTWRLYLAMEPECPECYDYTSCDPRGVYCPLPDILDFHRHLIPSEKALRCAMREISHIPFMMVAPQHGSVIADADEAELIMERLAALTGVGIDDLCEDPLELTAQEIRKARNEALGRES